MALEFGRSVYEVSIVRDEKGGSLGRCVRSKINDRCTFDGGTIYVDQADVDDEVSILLAGSAAERHFSGRSCSMLSCADRGNISVLTSRQLTAGMTESDYIDFITENVQARLATLALWGHYGNKMGTGLAPSAQCGYNVRASRQYRNCPAIKAFKHDRNLFPIRRRWQTYRTQNPVLGRQARSIPARSIGILLAASVFTPRGSRGDRRARHGARSIAGGGDRK